MPKRTSDRAYSFPGSVQVSLAQLLAANKVLTEFCKVTCAGVHGPAKRREIKKGALKHKVYHRVKCLDNRNHQSALELCCSYLPTSQR